MVNTNAGAVLLALVALASGREVLVSRGQLVEIGGGLPGARVLAASGCRLVEVGTTNRTRIADYARASARAPRRSCGCTPPTSAWSASPRSRPLDELAALARERGPAVIDDLGSGALRPTRRLAGRARRRAPSVAGGLPTS